MNRVLKRALVAVSTRCKRPQPARSGSSRLIVPSCGGLVPLGNAERARCAYCQSEVAFAFVAGRNEQPPHAAGLVSWHDAPGIYRAGAA